MLFFLEQIRYFSTCFQYLVLSVFKLIIIWNIPEQNSKNLPNITLHSTGSIQICSGTYHVFSLSFKMDSSMLQSQTIFSNSYCLNSWCNIMKFSWLCNKGHIFFTESYHRLSALDLTLTCYALTWITLLCLKDSRVFWQLPKKLLASVFLYDSHRKGSRQQK